MKLQVLGLVLPAVLLMPIAAQAQQTALIDVAGAAYDVTIPSGFCMPQGEQVAVSEYLASLDDQNDTKLHVVACAPDNPNYVIVKIAKAPPPVPLPKAEVLEILGQQLESQFGQELMQRESAEAGRSVAEKTDGQLQLTDNQTAFGGKDGDCAYLNGTSQVTDPTGTQTVIYASCLTSVEQTIVAIHSYALAGQGEGFDALEARSRSLAQTMVKR